MKKTLLYSTLVLLLVGVLYITTGFEINGDEVFHYHQIKLFLNLRFELDEYLTVVPGFHFILAIFARLLFLDGLDELRVLNFIFGMASVLIFYKTSIIMGRGNHGIKTILFIFLPFLFPYRYLLYTDSMSILFLVAAFYFLLKGKFGLSGIVSSASILIRQSNIVWLLFFTTVSLFKSSGNVTLKLQKSIFFLSGIFMFTLFVVFNQGISLGVTRSVHELTFFPGNLYWFLYSFFFLFFPVIFALRKSLYNLLSDRRYLAVMLIFIFINSAVFENLHSWNKTPDYFRNLVLMHVSANIILRIVYFLVVSLSVSTLYLLKFKDWVLYLFYPFAVISLLSSSLIEPRYSITPYTFLLLFLKVEDVRIYNKVALFFVIFSLLFTKLVLFDRYHL